MKKLTVIECPYCYAAWDVRIEDGKEIFRSSLRQYQNPARWICTIKAMSMNWPVCLLKSKI